MIEVVAASLGELEVEAILRPVSADWSAPTPSIRRLEVAAGREWTERCRAVGDLPVGSAVITDAGALPARFAIHVAIRSAEEPVGRRAVELGLRNGLRRAEEWGIRELALPLLGTGPGNLDAEAACAAMAGPLAAFVGTDPSRRVLVCASGDFEREAAAARWGPAASRSGGEEGGRARAPSGGSPAR